MHRVRTAAVFLVMSLTFLFGAAKFLDLPAFQRAVSTWDLIPEMARGITAATIPLLEMLFPGLWLVGVCRRQMLIVTLSLVTVFTVGFAIQWAVWAPPTCGCLGAIAAQIRGAEEAPLVLTRNVLFIAALCGGLWTRGRSHDVLADTEAGVHAY
jgi:hypothetical protein